MARLMKLTASNYYSLKANQQYFSVSQFKDFCRCEAMAMAKIKGEYEEPVTKSLLVGSFVDSYFEGSLEKFKAEHPEIFKRDNTLKAEYVQAEEIIRKINEDEFAMKFLSGEKQKILTFKLFGGNWKIKMDSFIKDICITDLKTSRNIESLPKWRYDIQGAIYQKGCELNGLGKLPFYLEVCTKEDIPDLEIFQIPQSTLDMAMREVEEQMPRYIDLKKGLIEPERCEKCSFCKATKKTQVRNYNELLV